MIMRRHRRTVISGEMHVRGFTLLEVLLTTMLSATLLLGLWAIFGTYLRLFKMGEVKAEQSQIVRVLTQQFSDDLMGVIQPAQHNRVASNNTHEWATFRQAPADNPTSSSDSSAASSPATIIQTAGSRQMASSASTSVTMPSFGLIGTKNSLRLDGLQTTIDAPSEVDADDFFAENKQPVGPRASELRTIVYSFRERSDFSPSPREPASGLLRQEFEWEAGSHGMLSSDLESRRQRRRSTRSNSSSVNGFPDLTAEELLEAEAMDDSLLWVPEVVGLEFRYFDGREWHSQWDSHQKQSLPVAVEMMMELDFEERPINGDHEIATHLKQKQSTSKETPSESESENKDLLVYRQLIHLPFAAANHRAESHANLTKSSTTSSDLFTPGGTP